jgi:hypothetical protein
MHPAPHISESSLIAALAVQRFVALTAGIATIGWVVSP